MAGAKKRKVGTQPSTLHDFFAPFTVKKPKCGPIPETAKPVETEDLEDVIVISDDEDESRPRLVSGLSNHGGAEAKSENCDSRIPLAPHQTSMEAQAQNVSIPMPLGDDPEPSFYEDWAMGDDEGIIPEEDEEGEDLVDDETSDTKLQLCEGSYPSDDNACPICGQTLKDFSQGEMHGHINSCIDASSGAPMPMKVEVKKRRSVSDVQPSPRPPSASSSAKPTSAFSVLMSSHKEDKAWKEASEAENQKGIWRGRRPAPFYKVMQGMPIAVDAFRYGKIPGVTAYFLTHAHSDHYTNLSSSWKNGPIYCSQTTANLIIHMLDVDPKWVHPLPMDKPTVVPNTGNVEVTLIQANHCPGSVLFLFTGTQTVNAGDSTFQSPFVGSQRIFRYLHCGDFRACPQHVLHSEIKDKKIDTVYLDTTYLDPKYCFPSQPQVVSACADLALRLVKGNDVADVSAKSDEKMPKDSGLNGWIIFDKGKQKQKEKDEMSKAGRVLVVVGTYTIGKERIVKAIAHALSTKVYCDPRKAAVLRCLSDPELHALITNDPFAAGVHLVPLHVVSSDTFKDYLAKWKGHWDSAVGFRPTGWTYTPPTGMDVIASIPHVIARDQARVFTSSHLRKMRNSTSTLSLYGVPYSEHSSFFELTCFALSLNWGKMIATVNVGNQKSREKMTKWFEKWQAERNKRERIGGAGIVEYREPDYW